MEWHLLNYMRKSRHNNILNLELLLSNILSPDIFYSKDKLIKTTTKITVLRIREKREQYINYIYSLRYLFYYIDYMFFDFSKKKKKLFNKKYQDRVTLRFIQMHKQFTAGVKFNDKISDKSVPFQTRCYVPLVIATENVQY